MYKLSRWLYELGAKNERKHLESDLFYYLSQQPVRYHDADAGMKESDEHFKKRIDSWFAARELIEKFFQETQPPNDVLT
jgi:hypothetical protein